MKEAAGEANLTVITIVLIAVVLAVGTLIVNGVLASSAKASVCSEFGGSMKAGLCQFTSTDTGKTYGVAPRRCYDYDIKYSKNRYAIWWDDMEDLDARVKSQCLD